MVIPLLNEEESIDQLLERLQQELNRLNLEWEIILVDDGSDDATWLKIAGFSQAEPRVKGISLSRNFGFQNAMFAGMNFAGAEPLLPWMEIYSIHLR